MRPDTVTKFSSFQKRLAESYNVASVAQMFSITAPQASRLVEHAQQSIAFLSMISSIMVTDIKGQIIMINAPSTVAGRTNTAEGDRTPVSSNSLTERTYECKKTEFDVALPYAQMDTLARFSDYEKRVLQMIYHRIGLDRLLIGWYGESCATATNRTTNSLLQDVNHGWLYDLKTNKAANYVKEASAGAKLKLGKGGDWRNLDALTFDLLSLIPEEHRTGNEMVLVGREIVAWEGGKIFSAHGQTPSEKAAFQVLSKTYGGLPATMPAGFPDKGVMVVDPANLQMYFQETSFRRQLVDNPKRDQVEHYQSSNECYRIGDLDAAAAVHAADIEFIDDAEDFVQSVKIVNTSAAPVNVQSVAASEVKIVNTEAAPVNVKGIGTSSVNIVNTTEAPVNTKEVPAT